MPRRTLMLALVLALMATPGWTAIPETMSYQGLLLDPGGTPVVNGIYDLTFRINDSEAGIGTVLWTETHTGVPVANGVLGVLLGSAGTPLTLPFDQPYFLGISIDADPELTPRVALASSPYALKAKSVPPGAIGTSEIADGTITGTDVAPGSLLHTELGNEAGVTSSSHNPGSQPMTTAPTNINSALISAPTSGFVIAFGSAEYDFAHTTGTDSYGRMSIHSASGSPNPNNQRDIGVSASATSGDYSFVNSVQDVFSIGPGPTRFYLVASELSGQVEAKATSLILLFVPTLYGNITAPQR